MHAIVRRHHAMESATPGGTCQARMLHDDCANVLVLRLAAEVTLVAMPSRDRAREVEVGEVPP